MKQPLVYATALLLAFGSTAYAQGAGVGGMSGGSMGGAGSKSGSRPTGAQSDTRLPPAPNSITAKNRAGNNSPLPGQPGNPQTGPIRR
jgi:hypothetical protein